MPLPPDMKNTFRDSGPTGGSEKRVGLSDDEAVAILARLGKLS